MQELIAEELCYDVDSKKLIDSISLKFRSGILHGILGPNGSGKSTLLRTLCGIWRATSGNVLWKGESLLRKERKEISQIISLVPQNPIPAFDYLVEDIVAMGRYPHGSRYWDLKGEHLVYQALQTTDAWHLRRRQVNQLSQGERQRVYIARALVTESPIMLLDEPTSSLDIRHQIEIWELLLNLVKGDKIVIVTCHDLATAEKYCDEIAIMNQGRCISNGPFCQTMTQEILATVFGVIPERDLNGKKYSLF